MAFWHGWHSFGHGKHWGCHKASGGGGSSNSTKGYTKGSGPYSKDPKDVKRGGWFSKCQLLAEAVLSSNWGTARDLAADFYSGEHRSIIARNGVMSVSVLH